MSVMAQPVPILKGTFAVYNSPDGGRVVAYKPEGEDESKQFVIPALIIKAMEAQARGESVNPFALIKSMLRSQE